MTYESGLVSTIIPVHNRPDMLGEAVSSVLQQTWRKVEVIIVDDESTDETPNVIAALCAEHPGIIRSVRRMNGGPGAARETGRQLIRGAYIQYLDSDDVLLPEKFSMQVAALQRRPDCGIAYCKTHHAAVGGKIEAVPFKRTGEAIEWLLPSMLRSRWWSTSTPLYKREVVDQIGPWLPLWNEEDWEYETRAGRLGVRLVQCHEFGSVTRWHDGDRLHVGGSNDRRKIADRSVAHLAILENAIAAGVSIECPEMRWYARDLFQLARICARVGLNAEAASLLRAAKEISPRLAGVDIRVFTLISKVVGWRLAGRMAAGFEKIRHAVKALRNERLD